MATRPTLLVFILAGLTLSACTTLPPNDNRPAPQPTPPRAPPTETVLEPIAEPIAELPQAPVPKEDKSHVRISIASVGDMMLGTNFPENRLPDDDAVSFLSHVTPFIASADIAIGNLEGVLIDAGTPAKTCKNAAACYLFRSPTRYADRFKEAGFDFLSLANNHARDFGEDGRSSSMRALSAVGIAHSGRAGTSAIIQRNDLSVALLAYAVTQKSNLLHDYERAFETVADFAEEHDIVIVTFHGGAEGANVMSLPFAEEEYFGEPRGDVVWFARGVVDAGADLVIGHGPHVVRAIERYNGRLIAYSLGNFATYYGISVAENKGIAPILTTVLNGNGEFVGGEIVSTIQLRPDGPSIDPNARALRLLRELSNEDFENPGIHFEPNGKITPIDRPEPAEHSLVTTTD